jgi:hypothetical protein
MIFDLPIRLGAFLLAASMMFPVQADDHILADKTSIQAAFLYNFALFTDWPSLPDNEFTICVIADDHMLEALASVRNKQIKDRTIIIKKIDSYNQAKICQILFVGNTEHPAMKMIAEKIGTTPVLVVSEEDAYDLKEVIIALGEQQNRISFKINRTEASQRSLTFSSKLLKLAILVY